MKAVILAGGYGTRISEETAIKPKPMVEIGEMPILWHIMKIYSQFGINEFVICCGFKGYVIKEFFSNYMINNSTVTIDLSDNSIQVHHAISEPWKVTLADTGLNTMTGGRLKRVQEFVGNETFCLTYGDGVSDIEIDKLIAFHREQNTVATLTAVQPPGRFGTILLGRDQTRISSFQEKPAGDGAWINGGYFVLEPAIFDLLENDACVFEQEPLRHLAHEGQLSAYRHRGFWQPMDTLRDKNYLESIIAKGEAPWIRW